LTPTPFGAPQHPVHYLVSNDLTVKTSAFSVPKGYIPKDTSLFLTFKYSRPNFSLIEIKSLFKHIQSILIITNNPATTR
jgi:hypothetical protein